MRVTGRSRLETGARAHARISVVIPALDEAQRLPVLLKCLEAQTRPACEIVVADAASVDGTRGIAAAHGALVVAGGLPGPGRNAGARAAHGDLILFMDADAQPAPDFIGRAVAEFERRGLEVATAPMRAVERGVEFTLACAAAEGYVRALQRLSPHAWGLCILVTRELHERIGGFDEAVVLAEDHDYARRAAAVGRFGILRDVRVPVSMRRVKREGRLRLARVLLYSEARTLAGIPIRSIPFDYTFGGYASGPDGSPTPVRRLMRELARPSTELQTDAIGLQVASAIGGGLGTAALAASGAGPEAYLPVAGVAATVVGLSAYTAVRKLRYEKHYGEFFMASVAYASADVRGPDGELLIRRGIDQVCELHAIGNLSRMADLSRSGLHGRLEIILETLTGLHALIDDMGSPTYEGVTFVTARSDLTTLLFKMGFAEVPDPPHYDIVNRVEKRALMWFIAHKVGRGRPGDADSYRMAISPVERFRSEEMRGMVDAQIARVRRDLARTGDAGAVR